MYDEEDDGYEDDGDSTSSDTVVAVRVYETEFNVIKED
jgi:hypothetical protein